MSKKEIVRFKMRYERYYKVAFHNLPLSDDYSLSAKAAKQNYLWRKQYVEKRNS